MTSASVVIQTHLTFTAKRWGQAPSITFRNGASCSVVSASPSAIVMNIVSGTTTMAQIKAAVEANNTATSGFCANDLVTVTIAGGHTADTVKTLVAAALSGGAVAAKATKVLGHLRYTAKSTGTAGNSTRIKYTSGATLTITVSTADITVQLRSDGTTTNALIKAAIENDVAAAALVDLASDGVALSFKPDVSAAAAFTALAGGAAAAAATVTIQSLVVTADATGVATNGATLTLTTGATAGSEVVTMSGNNISCQIENGVSSLTQVRTALNAAGAFDAIYAATGTSATAMVTVNAAAMTGAVGPSLAGSLGFYADQSTVTLTTAFQYLPMGNFMGAMSIYNDETSGTDTLIFSWDGINNHGSLLPTQSVELGDVNKSGIYVKYANGAPDFRAFAVAH